MERDCGLTPGRRILPFCSSTRLPSLLRGQLAVVHSNFLPYFQVLAFCDINGSKMQLFTGTSSLPLSWSSLLPGGDQEVSQVCRKAHLCLAASTSSGIGKDPDITAPSS